MEADRLLNALVFLSDKYHVLASERLGCMAEWAKGHFRLWIGPHVGLYSLSASKSTPLLQPHVSEILQTSVDQYSLGSLLNAGFNVFTWYKWYLFLQAFSQFYSFRRKYRVKRSLSPADVWKSLWAYNQYDYYFQAEETILCSAFHSSSIPTVILLTGLSDALLILAWCLLWMDGIDLFHN